MDCCARALNKEDLPTLGRPTNPMRIFMVQVGPLRGDAMVGGGDPKKVDFAIGKLLTNLHVNDDRISKYSSVIIVFGVPSGNIMLWCQNNEK